MVLEQSLKAAFFMHLEVEEPELILNNQAGSLVNVKVKSGYTKTVDEEYPFDTTIEFGWDNLRTSTATGATTTLDCQLFLKSKDSGAGIQFNYSGVVVASEAQGKVLKKESKEHDYLDGYVTSHPTVVLDEKATKESWITSKNLLGRGHFVRNEKNELAVEYYVYVLEWRLPLYSQYISVLVSTHLLSLLFVQNTWRQCYQRVHSWNWNQQ